MVSRIKSKKSQVTIFVIVALLIVGSIALVFMLSKPAVQGEISPTENPKAYIQKCARDAASDAFREIITHGGFFNPASYVKKSGVKIALICYTESNYQLCTNVHPVLEKEMEDEIYEYAKPIVEKCFEDVKAGNARYNYNEEPLNMSIAILPSQIAININKKISYDRNEGEGTVSIDTFDTKINSPAFDFVRITKEIINDEVSCNCLTETCNTDLVELNNIYRDYTITKPVYSGNGEEIYVIKEDISGKEFNFAIRNCVRFP
jgi:hypothetical protein